MSVFLSSPRRLAVICLAGVLAIAGTSCPSKPDPDKSKSKSKSKKQKEVVPVVVGEPKTRPLLEAAKDEQSKAIEQLTGEHTRVVWTEHQVKGQSDSFSYGDEQLLRGIDTRDGLGERTILGKKGNYSRPFLSRDGESILYTRRATSGRNGKELTLTIYRTDWMGSGPYVVATGYGASTWTDPATGIEWIYCTRKFKGNRGNKFVARQLWRFQLDKPLVEELVYDETKLSPTDNIQLSRDGKRACALMPWPQGGVIELDANPPTPHKLTNGCWPSMAPDSSGISWVFDGQHRSAHFFADDGARKWTVKFDAPCAAVGETYHPRWSNSPRFIALTGPYIADRSGQLALHNSDNQPDVYLGKMSASADRMEGWVKVSKTGFAKALPDAWIAGGEKVNFDVKHAAESAGGRTHKTRASDATLFLWTDRNSLNQWKSHDGQSHSADLTGLGAARYGRWEEMVFDGGEFRIDEDEEGEESTAQQMKKLPDGAFECEVLPGAGETAGWLFRSPKFGVQLVKDILTVTTISGRAVQVRAEELAGPFHLVVNCHEADIKLYVNGRKMMLGESPAVEGATLDDVVFGSASMTRGMRGVVIYDRTLGDEEAATHAAAAQKGWQTLAASPHRVRLKARLVETSAVPTLAEIEPYTSTLVSSLYEVESVVAGEFKENRVLVRHWALLNKEAVISVPKKVGGSHELVLEPAADHPELEGERAVDQTEAFELEPWYDVTTPVME